MVESAHAPKAVSDIAASDIVETVPSALIILDRNLIITSANRAFYQTFRTSPVRPRDAIFTTWETGSGISPRCAPCLRA